jgi:hypothetical protein
MVKVLFSRPSDDVTLGYLYYYSNKLVRISKKLGHETINKEKSDANRNVLTSLIVKQNPKLMMFNGHGSPEEICGHKQEVIISAKENSEILNGAIIYSISCSSALILGPKSVKEGAECFIGYELDFALGKDPDSEASPRHDKIARLFLKPSNTLFSNLLKGKDVKSAVVKAKKEMEENIDYLHTTDSFPEAIYYAPFLYGNYLGLVSHGDNSSCI